VADDGPVADEVKAFKREVDAGFDEALAEVTAELAAVPVPAAIPLPGLGPAAYPEPGEDVPFLPPPAGGEPSPLQEKLDLATEAPAHGDGTDEDAIVEFAPDPGMDWGPRRPKLPGRGAQRDET
jgi:hypothetical protein